MARLIISTRRGQTYEAEVRDIHDANREMGIFAREYLNKCPGDSIIDASVIEFGSIISRFNGRQLEDF